MSFGFNETKKQNPKETIKTTIKNKLLKSTHKKEIIKRNGYRNIYSCNRSFLLLFYVSFLFFIFIFHFKQCFFNAGFQSASQQALCHFAVKKHLPD